MSELGVCCEVAGPGCTRENVFRQRLRSILGLLGCQYPSLFPFVDFWRPAVVGPEFDECGYEKSIDETPEKWVRLGESIAAFVYDKWERFYQADVGVVRQKVKWVLVPEGLGLQVDDHVIISGFAYMITDVLTEMGVTKLQVDFPKSRFVKPGRFDPTYRQMTMKAAIQ